MELIHGFHSALMARMANTLSTIREGDKTVGGEQYLPQEAGAASDRPQVAQPARCIAEALGWPGDPVEVLQAAHALQQPRASADCPVGPQQRVERANKPEVAE